MSRVRIREQLDSTMQSWNKKATLPITLSGYHFLDGALDNKSALGAIREKLMSDNSVIPQFDGVNASSFRMATLQQSNQDARQADTQPGTQLRQALDTLLKEGQALVELQWNNK